MDYPDTSYVGYTWDGGGNLTDTTGTTSAINFTGRTYSSNRVGGWTYDSYGNLTYDLANTYTYDARGRLTRAEAGTNFEETSYDVFDRKVLRRMTISGATHFDLYYYDAAGRMIARFTAATTTSTPAPAEVFIYLGNQPIAFLDFTGAYPNGELFWLQNDLQGTARMVTDSDGVTIGTTELFPFGQLRSETGTMNETAWAYAGHERAPWYG